MTRNQEKALAALMTHRTMKEAAEAAGIDPRTLRRYMRDNEFLREYRQITTDMLQDARMFGQKLLQPTMQMLASICFSKDDETKNTERIAAARVLMEWTVRLTEFTDIVERLEALERV